MSKTKHVITSRAGVQIQENLILKLVSCLYTGCSPNGSMHQNHLKGLLKHSFLGMCICSKLLTDAAADLGDYTLIIIALHYQRRKWHPTPVLLPGESHGRRSLVGCSPWGREESDTTERLHFHFSLSCIGEGNGNPLQHSCLENPRDGGAWRAAIYGVAQSRT